MIEVFRFKTKEEAIESAGKKLNELFLSHRHVPVLFLSSGGSALELLDEIEISYLPKDLTIGVLDERIGSDLKVSNIAQLRATPFGARLEEIIVPDKLTFKKDHPEGKIFITQGVGADGHTAGILPFPEDPKKFQELFEDKEVLSIKYDAGGKTEYPERVTVTMPFLRQVDHSVVFLLGEEKRNALERMLAKDGPLHETPARIVHEMRQVSIFTDIQ